MANAPWYGSFYTLLPIMWLVMVLMILRLRAIYRRRSAPTLDTSCAVKTARTIVITQTFGPQRDEDEETYIVQRIRGANV